VSRLRSPLWWGGAIVAVVAVAAVLAPWLAPFHPSAIPGASLEGPSSRYLLGTNDIGQDIFSQLLWGSRTSLAIALPAAALALALGISVGMGSGLAGGMVDVVTMRAVDIFLALPALPILVLVAALVGPSRLTLVATIGGLTWPGVARILRSETLTVRQRGFVAAARGFGAGPTTVVRRHLLPALSPVAVAVFLQVATAAVFLEAGLGFLGLSDPTTVSWGQVLRRAVTSPALFNTSQWVWWVLPAGFTVTLALVGLNLIGVGVETRMNPRRARH